MDIFHLSQKQKPSLTVFMHLLKETIIIGNNNYSSLYKCNLQNWAVLY